ncbi:MAG: 5-(carboxyamino)imidazole ribonucleotide synthase [Chloroflexi bacterium]|nr:5-(carboxyamino)imidazole ribonucleotide synthase [Chloroflexota bacterium]
MEIGIVGGGQLGRMLALAAYPLGARVTFLDPAPDAPLRHLAKQICAAYDDERALEQLARDCAVVTYEFENVPVTSALHLEQFTRVFPPPAALHIAQDRWEEKAFFSALGIPTPKYARVDTHSELVAALENIGLPAVLKTRRLGYDGKGQFSIATHDDVTRAWNALDGMPLILEAFVNFTRELSILAVRGQDGACVFYPLVENVHREGILRTSLAPASNTAGALQTHAEDYARRVLGKLNYVGVLAMELFQVGNILLANEMAPRVHNSGHWTIEGAATSQFENHMRAILGMPLGSTETRGYCAMVNFIGALPDVNALLQIPDAHAHVYDKAPRVGRKLGHVTVLADDETTRDERLQQALEIVHRESTRILANKDF